jgi:hypothetical protein
MVAEDLRLASGVSVHDMERASPANVLADAEPVGTYQR